MKIALAFTFILFASFARAQSIMTFERIFIRMDTITQFGEGTAQLKFTNTGNKPLVIADCKTTTPEESCSWDKKALAPGQTAYITYKLRPKTCGKWNNPVTVTSKDGDVTVIHVKCFIRCKDEAAD
jgi:hypothetical protein